MRLSRLQPEAKHAAASMHFVNTEQLMVDPGQRFLRRLIL